MRVDVLTEDSPILDAVRLGLRGAKSETWVLKALFSWEEFISRAGRQAFDIALVQTTFPVSRSLDPGGVRFLERAGEVSKAAILIPVLARSSQSPPSLRSLDPVRFPIVLIEGTDDHPHVILRALARASVLRRVQALPVVPPRPPDPAVRQAAVSFVAHWPPASSPEWLARRRNVSPRTLRRQCSRCGLPTPRRLFRWGRLLEAFALWEMGAGTRERIAYILGAGGASTLAHLSRDLLGRSLDEVLQPDSGDDLLRAFFQDLAG